jgi:sigma-B regulation protein RsbU (phosphoserine phosphatase)
MASLVFVAGPNAGRRYKLGDGEYIIGRRSDCQIFVPDMRVSRQHARIRRERGRFWVEDLGSNNGTFVNGSKIANHTDLKHDDEITIANNRIRVELPESTTGRQKTDGLESHVTIVDVGTSNVFKSRDESDSGQVWRSSSLVTAADARTRLLERKLAALTAILEAAAHTPDPEQLLERVVEQLLELFTQAESVGVLVQDERTGDLRVQCQRNRQNAQHGEMRVPGTIIEHVVADRRGVLLGETTGQFDPPAHEGEPVGTRMGAPVVAQQISYGVIYVES